MHIGTIHISVFKKGQCSGHTSWGWCLISFDNLLAASKICRLESNVDIYVRITPYTSLHHRIYMWYQNTFFYTKWYTVTVLCIGRNCKWNAHYLCLIASFHLAVGSNQYLVKNIVLKNTYQHEIPYIIQNSLDTNTVELSLKLALWFIRAISHLSAI